MNAIDLIVLALVIFLLQLPLLIMVYLRDEEIRRLNAALLRVEQPTVSATIQKLSPTVKTQEEIKEERRKLELRKALWSR